MLSKDTISGYLGYPTAWMMAQLQGDGYAAGAFAKDGGEYSPKQQIGIRRKQHREE